MSPAERARQIDKEEFAAECAAIRQRALFAVEERRIAERMRASSWLTRTAPSGKFNPVSGNSEKANRPKQPHPSAHRFTHDGRTLTLKEWADVTGISSLSLRSRLANGWSIGETLTVPVKMTGKRTHRGVSSNFIRLEGTGAGSTAQESPNITFSGIDA
jgi:hypothetical protein